MVEPEIQLLMGNEAIARGALEAGVSFAAGYPGNPSSEIIETLAGETSRQRLYVEWSINEKVALEAAAAASFSGLRALAAMKQNGVNVASDFITNLTLSGTGAGLLLITCDDPSGISSTNEQDARFIARLADLPLLEPSSPQEALEMTRWAFDLSEALQNLVVLRSVSRLSHARQNCRVGELNRGASRPVFDLNRLFHTFPVTAKHQIMHDKLARAAAAGSASPFNRYEGPAAPELIVVTCGTGWDYSREAVELLGLKERVGVLKLGLTWPLPSGWLKPFLFQSARFLFIEEVDPFLEGAVMEFAAQMGPEIGAKEFFGKGSGHIPVWGEQSPDRVLQALGRILHVPYDPREASYEQKASSWIKDLVPPREFGFCPGCPHRATYWSIKKALKLDGRNGFVAGDIGCYTMGIFPTGFMQIKTVHAMGSGVGLMSGFGQLQPFGFSQPVISVVGDSTFFHAAIPAVINLVHNRARALLLVLDNQATAMTGFQPHPGLDTNVLNQPAPAIAIEDLCASLGVSVDVLDPYELEVNTRTIYRALQETEGVRVLVLRRTCALVQGRAGG
ncbi:MAG: thiamine pyrophosphate-dependent enzyme, partial [Desulfobacterota bacterium]|nr:thiamine pyrophosphate-dependent enzyme [Thermodesulfobacteriota bacterium]